MAFLVSLERLGGIFNSCRGVCGTSGVCIRGVSTYYLGWGASSSNSTRNLGPIFGTSCVSLGLVGELEGSRRHFFALVFNLGPNLGLLFE